MDFGSPLPMTFPDFRCSLIRKKRIRKEIGEKENVGEREVEKKKKWDRERGRVHDKRIKRRNKNEAINDGGKKEVRIF